MTGTGATVAYRWFKAIGEPELRGDFNGDNLLDIQDIEDLVERACADFHSTFYDLDDNAVIDQDDVYVWITGVFGSWLGDANLDGQFNSSDMVQVFTAGKYETGRSAGWAEGNWTGDCVFDSSDMVAAHAEGGYEKGSRPPAVAVPEPTSIVLLVTGLIGVAVCRRRPQL
jgi:hypothetical protein